MNIFFAKLFSSFCFSKKSRRRMRLKLSKKIRIAPGNDFEDKASIVGKCLIRGSRNTVIVRGGNEDCDEYFNHLEIEIFGNGNLVEIDEDVRPDGNVKIYIGRDLFPCDNARIHIGRGTGINDADIRLMENGSVIEIGSDCLISWDVTIWATDSHSIFDDNEKIANEGKFVRIGNHVWIGMGVKIGKNVEIPDGCIVGWGSVVSHKFSEKNAIIAGNPARIVKTNRHWKYPAVSYFLK